MLRERVNPSRRRLLAEQIVAVVVLGCGKKVDAMWHVTQSDAMWHVPHMHILTVSFHVRNITIVLADDTSDVYN